ncbi:unnamed protein product [Amoebophrya sp. A120]|nr:unnamed protein product [Amoebophrya sp. A120]|eukprot:GSA120T00016412001.1
MMIFVFFSKRFLQLVAAGASVGLADCAGNKNAAARPRRRPPQFEETVSVKPLGGLRSSQSDHDHDVFDLAGALKNYDSLGRNERRDQEDTNKLKFDSTEGNNDEEFLVRLQFATVTDNTRSSKTPAGTCSSSSTTDHAVTRSSFSSSEDNKAASSGANGGEDPSTLRGPLSSSSSSSSTSPFQQKALEQIFASDANLQEFEASLTQGRVVVNEVDNRSAAPKRSMKLNFPTFPPGATLLATSVSSLDWSKLVFQLSGLLCASFEAMDTGHTGYEWIQPVEILQHTTGGVNLPKKSLRKHETARAATGTAAPPPPEEIDLPTRRAAPPRRRFYMTLPYEPVCTENLTPWLRLLPCRKEAGIAQFLGGKERSLTFARARYFSLTFKATRQGRVELALTAVLKRPEMEALVVQDIIGSLRSYEELRRNVDKNASATTTAARPTRTSARNRLSSFRPCSASKFPPTVIVESPLVPSTSAAGAATSLIISSTTHSLDEVSAALLRSRWNRTTKPNVEVQEVEDQEHGDASKGATSRRTRAQNYYPRPHLESLTVADLRGMLQGGASSPSAARTLVARTGSAARNNSISEKNQEKLHQEQRDEGASGAPATRRNESLSPTTVAEDGQVVGSSSASASGAGGQVHVDTEGEAARNIKSGHRIVIAENEVVSPTVIRQILPGAQGSPRSDGLWRFQVLFPEGTWSTTSQEVLDGDVAVTGGYHGHEGREEKTKGRATTPESRDRHLAAQRQTVVGDETTSGRRSSTSHYPTISGITVTESLPYFLQPLWSTSMVVVKSRSSSPAGALVEEEVEQTRDVEETEQTYSAERALDKVQLRLRARREKKGQLVFDFFVPNVAVGRGGSMTTFTVHLVKRFVHTDDFSFASEKGFDVGSAAWQIVTRSATPSLRINSDRNKPVDTLLVPQEAAPADAQEHQEIFFTTGALVMVQMPDFSMPFNVVCLASTFATFFFSQLFRFTTAPVI